MNTLEKPAIDSITDTFSNIGNVFMSLFIGMFAFSIIKILYSIGFFAVVFIVGIVASFMDGPMNLDSSDLKLLNDIELLLIIPALFNTITYVKKLNRTGTRKSRNIKRVLIIVIGFICAMIIGISNR